jgi:hypothetical protein
MNENKNPKIEEVISSLLLGVNTTGEAVRRIL